MRLASQALAMEVEQAVVSATEMRGASSKAVLVTLFVHKVSSDAIGLSHRANEHLEGSGRGRGGHGGRVCHYQAQGLSAGSATGWHQRCMQDLQEGRGHSKCTYGTSTARALCKSAKLCCSLVQGQHGQRKPTEAEGSSAAVEVVVEMTNSKSSLSVFPSLTHRFDRWKHGSAFSQGWTQQKGCLAHRGR